MPSLEIRIKEWRTRMTQALPQRDEAVAELEEHVREHFTALQRQGKSDEEAFALAVERVGEPHAIAREFERMPAGWRPGFVMLPMLGLILALLMVLYLWKWSQYIPLTAFQVCSFVTSTTGGFGMLGSALIATAAILKSARRPLSERERLAVRRMLGKLARLAGVFVPIGWAFGTMWRAHSDIYDQLAVSSYHMRLAGVFVSVALLNYTLFRPAIRYRLQWIAAICPSLVVLISNPGPLIRVAGIPVAWFCVVFILAQVVFVLPRFRIRIERLHEPN